MSQVGSLSWADAHSGNLTHTERLRLLIPITQTTFGYVYGRFRLLLGLRPTIPIINYDALTFPDSQLAKHAEQACHETLSPAIINHSYRTYLYALALAQLDKVTYDTEHLYVTCLLHDIALEKAETGHCFALRGAKTMSSIAHEAGCTPDTAHILSEAICSHITPGLTYHHNTLGALINYGALLDLVGMRLWHISPAMVESAIARYPRHHLKNVISQFWRNEARTVPRGRASLIEKLAFFTFFIRIAPFSE